MALTSAGTLNVGDLPLPQTPTEQDLPTSTAPPDHVAEEGRHDAAQDDPGHT